MKRPHHEAPWHNESQDETLAPRSLSDSAEEDDLDALWRQTSPADPSPEAWDKVWQGVEKALNQKSSPDHPRRSSLLGSPIVGLLVAASLVLAVGIQRFFPLPEEQIPAQKLTRSEEPVLDLTNELVLTTSNEIEINCMDEADASALIVGAPPVSGPLPMASNSDITLDHAELLGGNQVDLYKPEQGPPMLVVLLEK